MAIKHKGTVTLETERLILRRFEKGDLEQIYHNCWSDPDVWKWTNYEPMDSIDEVCTLNNIFTDNWFARNEKLNWYSWAIQLKSSSEVIGRASGIKPDERISQIELACQSYTMEKVLRLANILDYLNTNLLTKDTLALQGGRAINLTVFNLLRLSVDLDLDYSV